MKYVKQFGIIMAVTCVAEGLKYILPFPFPASIYGLVLMLILLMTKAVKPEWVKEAGEFLVEIMPIMFVPAAVGLMVSWKAVQSVLWQILLIVVSTTVLVMVVSGKITDFVIDRQEKKKK